MITRILSAVALSGGTLLCWPAAGEAAPAACPDIEVVFARGTGEPPGVGWMGQQFIDALQWRTWGRTVGVYPVDFPAVPEFGPSATGVSDAIGHISDLTLSCPATQMVLGGYSRGAALMGYVTEPTAGGAGPPLPPEASDHITAVALLGKPSAMFLQSLGAPPLTVGSSYSAKTIDLCAPGDPVCEGGADGAAHAAYATNGMTAQAADFVVGLLRPAENLPEPPL